MYERIEDCRLSKCGKMGLSLGARLSYPRSLGHNILGATLGFGIHDTMVAGRAPSYSWCWCLISTLRMVLSMMMVRPEFGSFLASCWMGRRLQPRRILHTEAPKEHLGEKVE